MAGDTSIQLLLDQLQTVETRVQELCPSDMATENELHARLSSLSRAISLCLSDTKKRSFGDDHELPVKVRSLDRVRYDISSQCYRNPRYLHRQEQASRIRTTLRSPLCSARPSCWR